MPEIESFVRIQGERFNIKKGTDILVQEASKVDSSFFHIFTAEFLEGSPKTALKDPKSVVLSEEVAEKFFGKTKAVGKTISIDYDGGFQDFTVSAVTKKSPINSSIQINLLLPMHKDKRADNIWINFYLNTFVKLNPKANPKTVEAKFAKIFAIDAKEQIADAKKNWGFKNKIDFKLQSFLAMHLSTDYKAQNGVFHDSNPLLSYALTGIALFILLIACINFINLTVARSLKRAKEIGIRKVVGGDKKQLIMQFLGESFVLSLGSFLLALILVETLLPFFNTVSNKALSLNYLFDSKLIFSYIALFLCTGFLAGFYPALVMSGFKPAETLYGRFKFSGGNILQKSLVVLQFALATFFIILTITIYQQFELFTTKDLGYDDKNLIVIPTGEMNQIQAETFRNELLKNPDIEKVSPRNGGVWNTISKVNGSQEINYSVEVIDDNYLNTLGLKITKGRNFSDEFTADSSSSVLVNEAFVKEAKWKNPIGQTVDFFFRNHKYQVVGVVKDYYHESLHSKIIPQMFTCDPNMGSYGSFWIKISSANIPKTLKSIEKSFKNFLPTRPYQYEFKSESNLKQYDEEARYKQIISFSALLTIFISCIGLFGLAMLSAEKRTKEIGIRKVLGASVQSIVSMLSVDFLKLILIASAISFPIAWWASNTVLQNYPFRIEISVWIFVGALTTTCTVAFLTIGYQALKSAMANPVKSLRTE